MTPNTKLRLKHQYIVNGSFKRNLVSAGWLVLYHEQYSIISIEFIHGFPFFLNHKKEPDKAGYFLQINFKNQKGENCSTLPSPAIEIGGMHGDSTAIFTRGSLTFGFLATSSFHAPPDAINLLTKYMLGILQALFMA